MSAEKASAGEAKHVNTDSWLTCVQVADVCGIAIQTVLNYKRRGTLHPVRAERMQSNGAHRVVDVYDPQEVVALPRRKLTAIPNDPGELAARVFELFDAGVPMRDVVTQLRVAPPRVAELHDQWLDFGGSELVIGKAARVELERFVGSFDGVAGLVQRLCELLGKKIEIVVDESDKLARASDAEVERAILGVLEREGAHP